MMRFTIYRRWTIAGRRWFWRLQAKNNRIIAVGGEGFHNRTDVEAIIAEIQRNSPIADVEVAR